MLHHKPLPIHSACNVICGQTDSNSGMQNFMKKVSVHCEFASEMLSKIKFYTCKKMKEQGKICKIYLFFYDLLENCLLLVVD